MKKLICCALLLAPSFAWANQEFDKDFDKNVGYCSGLVATLVERNPDYQPARDALKELKRLLEEKGASMDVQDSKAQAMAYAAVVERARLKREMEPEDTDLPMVIALGLAACKAVGIQAVAAP